MFGLYSEWLLRTTYCALQFIFRISVCTYRLSAQITVLLHVHVQCFANEPNQQNYFVNEQGT